MTLVTRPEATVAGGELGALAGSRIAITGARGYVGSALLRRLAGVVCDVRRVMRPGATAPAVQGAVRVEDVAGDLGDPAFWAGAIDGADVVIHLAGQTSTYVANRDSAGDVAANVLPVVHLLEACRGRATPPLVLLAGTVTVAGLPEKLPVDEAAPLRPVTVYDLHKLAAEQYLETYARLGAARGATLRLANVYGPGPASGSADRGILNLMMRRALAGEALTVYGPGDYLRDYVHVDDVARAFLLAAAHGDAVSGRHFVIGTGEGTRLVDAIGLVAERAERLTGTRAAVRHVDEPTDLSPIERRQFVADSSAFTAATGWRPRFRLREGIDDTLAFFRGGQGGRA